MAVPEITKVSEGLSVAAFETVALVYFPAKSPSEADLGSMRSHLVATAARAPKGFSALLLVPESGGPPDGKARDIAAEMFQSLRGRLKVMAGVLEGAGFGAAAKRSVLTLLLGAVSRPAAVKVFSSAAPACSWVEEQAVAQGMTSVSALDLEACLDMMRKNH